MTDIETNKIDFPKSIWEFILDNSFKDTEEIYTNGALLIPTYRVKQAIEHYYDPKSVTPQPKRGKWIVIRKEYEFMGGIVNEPQGCKCSNCDGIVKLKSDFCPNCGADMREVQDER